MASRTFGDPVGGGIRPYGSPSDPPNFRVTRPFADASMPQYGPHDGLDLGNGEAHAPILAMDDGEVYQAFFDSNSGGAGIVRIDHGDGWTTGYAHMDEIYVRKGDRVSKGQKIARMDNTGWSSGAHLHMDTTQNGTRRDPWPLLASAQEEVEDPMDIDSEKWITAVYNRRWYAKAPGAKLRAGPGPNHEVLRTMEPGRPFEPTAKVIGGAYNESTRWFLGWKEDAGEWKTVAVSVTELEEQSTIETVEAECPPPPDPCAQVGEANQRALMVVVLALLVVALCVGAVLAMAWIGP